MEAGTGQDGGGRVLVLGAVHVDLVVALPTLPGPGETVVGGALRRGWGGKGANQALAAAAAGARVRLLGAVGDDAEGRAALQRLSERGVDVGGVRVVAGEPTGTAVVLVDAAGENAIAVAPGAGAALAPGELDVGAGLGDVLLVSLELPGPVVVDVVRAAVRAGARVVLNLAPARDLPADVLAAADPVVANAVEARAMVRAGGAPPSLVVTEGAAGARWGDLHVPAPAVPVVDTTGAGDAACGALAAALAAGADPLAALRAAVQAGSRAVQVRGAQG